MGPWERLWLKNVIQMVGRGPGKMKFGKSRGDSVQKREKVKRIRFCRKSNEMKIVVQTLGKIVYN